MVLRVVQWSTGNVGAVAVRNIVEHPELELVGVHAHSEHKVGKDAAELAGLDTPTGVIATNDVDALIALKPDCIHYSPIVRDLDLICRFLEAGINVVGTARFITGAYIGEDSTNRLEQACKTGNSSIYGTGLNPGTTNAVAILAAGMCDRIYSIDISEGVDVTRYASKDTWESLGWGQPLGSVLHDTSAQEFETTEVREAMEMTAEAIGIEIDEVRFETEFAIANEDIELSFMSIPKGTVAGQRSTYHGMRNGRSVVRQSIAYSMGTNITPAFHLGGYLMEVEGEPSVQATLSFPKPKVDGVCRPKHSMDRGMVVVASAGVNAIPLVCAAPAGIRKVYELPLITARGLAVD